MTRWTVTPRPLPGLALAAFALLVLGYIAWLSVQKALQARLFEASLAVEWLAAIAAICGLVAAWMITRRARALSLWGCLAVIGVGALLLADPIERQSWPAMKLYVAPVPFTLRATAVVLAFMAAIAVVWPENRARLLAMIRSTEPTASQTRDGWHSALLASLRGVGIQPTPDQFYRAVLAWLALVTIGVTLQLLIRGAPFEVALIVWLGGLAATPLVLRLMRLFWQLRSPSAEEELSRNRNRRPSFYLRSFELDAAFAKPQFGMVEFLLGRPRLTMEQMITRALRRRGPVIAIGRPGERLPSLGAARFYVDDESWKSKVNDITAAAEVVVWATGVTDGLRWELDHLIGTVPPDRLIVWAHPHALQLPPEEREREWARFCDGLGSRFPVRLPRSLGATVFFHFGPNFEPIGVAPRERPALRGRDEHGPAPSARRQASALRELLAAKRLLRRFDLWRERAWRAAPFAAGLLTAALMGAGFWLACGWVDTGALTAVLARAEPLDVAYALYNNEHRSIGGTTPEAVRATQKQWLAGSEGEQHFTANPRSRSLAEAWVRIYDRAAVSPPVAASLLGRRPLYVDLASAADAQARAEAASGTLEAVVIFLGVASAAESDAEDLRDHPSVITLGLDTLTKLAELRRTALEADLVVLHFISMHAESVGFSTLPSGQVVPEFASDPSLQQELVRLEEASLAASLALDAMVQELA